MNIDDLVDKMIADLRATGAKVTTFDDMIIVDLDDNDDEDAS